MGQGFQFWAIFGIFVCAGIDVFVRLIYVRKLFRHTFKYIEGIRTLSFVKFIHIKIYDVLISNVF